MSLQNTESQSPAGTRIGRPRHSAPSDPGGPPVASDFLPPTGWPTLQTTLAELCLCLTESVPSVESAGVVIFPPEPALGRRRAFDRAEVIGAAPAGAAGLAKRRLALDSFPLYCRNC